MQNLKKKTVGTSIDEEHKPTEIFIMLPLDIIAVGELQEGDTPVSPQSLAGLWHKKVVRLDQHKKPHLCQ